MKVISRFTFAILLLAELASPSSLAPVAYAAACDTAPADGYVLQLYAPSYLVGGSTPSTYPNLQAVLFHLTHQVSKFSSTTCVEHLDVVQLAGSDYTWTGVTTNYGSSATLQYNLSGDTSSSKTVTVQVPASYNAGTVSRTITIISANSTEDWIKLDDGSQDNYVRGMNNSLTPGGQIGLPSPSVQAAYHGTYKEPHQSFDFVCSDSITAPYMQTGSGLQLPTGTTVQNGQLMLGSHVYPGTQSVVYSFTITHRQINNHGNGIGSCDDVSTETKTLSTQIQVKPAYFVGFNSIDTDGSYAGINMPSNTTNQANYGSINLRGIGPLFPLGKFTGTGVSSPDQVTFQANMVFQDDQGNAVAPLKDGLEWIVDPPVPQGAVQPDDSSKYTVNFADKSAKAVGLGGITAVYDASKSGIPIVTATKSSGTTTYTLDSAGTARRKRNLAIWNLSGLPANSDNSSQTDICSNSTKLEANSQLQFNYPVTPPVLGSLINTAVFTVGGQGNRITSNTASALITAPQPVQASMGLAILGAQIQANLWQEMSSLSIFTSNPTYQVQENLTDYPLTTASHFDPTVNPVYPSPTAVNVDTPHSRDISPSVIDFLKAAPSSRKLLQPFSINWIPLPLPANTATTYQIDTKTPDFATQNAYIYTVMHANLANQTLYPDVFYGVGACSKAARARIEGDVYTGGDIVTTGISFRPVHSAEGDGIEVIAARGQVTPPLLSKTDLSQLSAYSFNTPDIAGRGPLALEDSVILNEMLTKVQALLGSNNESSLDTDANGQPWPDCATAGSSAQVCLSKDNPVAGENTLVVRSQYIYLNPGRVGGKLVKPFEQSVTAAFSNITDDAYKAAVNDKSNPEGRLWVTNNNLRFEGSNPVHFTGLGTIASTKTISIQTDTDYVRPGRPGTVDTQFDQNQTVQQQQRLEDRTSLGLIALRGDLVQCDKPANCNYNGLPSGYLQVPASADTANHIPGLADLETAYDYNSQSIIRSISFGPINHTVGNYFAPFGTASMPEFISNDFQLIGSVGAGAFEFSQAKPNQTNGHIFLTYDRPPKAPPLFSRILTPELVDRPE